MGLFSASCGRSQKLEQHETIIPTLATAQHLYVRAVGMAFLPGFLLQALYQVRAQGMAGLDPEFAHACGVYFDTSFHHSAVAVVEAGLAFSLPHGFHEVPGDPIATAIALHHVVHGSCACQLGGCIVEQQ